MMKKYIAYIICMMVFLTGCEDFLTMKNLTEKSTESFPNTEKEANEIITAIYAQLLFEDPELSSYIFTAQLAGDDCLGGNLHSSDNCAANFLLYSANTGLNKFVQLWSRCYALIARANVALETLDNVAEWTSVAERNRHFGEAYFLRAFAYNELAQMFGGVPLRTESTNTANIPRASVDEVYEVIASDLKNAIELMPPRIYLAGSPMAGHATKYAAQAMMARVFLFYTGRYAKTELPGGITKEQVIEWIDDCVYSSGHDLVSDQRNLWAYTNPASGDNDEGFRYRYATDNRLQWVGNSSVETVFANKHKLEGNSWTYTWFSNKVSLFYSPPNESSTNEKLGSERYPFGAGWGAGPVSPAMVTEWLAWSQQQTFLNNVRQDPRITGSIWAYRALDPNSKVTTVLFDRRIVPNEPDYTVSYRYYEQTGYQNKKYINILSRFNGVFVPFGVQMYPELTIGAPSESLHNIADLIHIRFADVLLMQSELKEDVEGLNRVRSRSNLAPIGAYSLQALKNERRWELAFESLRWWDLLRWSGPSLEEAGDALNKQTGFTLLNAAVETPMVVYDYKTRLKAMQGYWPIPQMEIDRTNGVVTQNPGWGTEALFTSWNNM